MVKNSILAATLFVFMTMIFGCTEERTVTFVNRTGAHIEVRQNGARLIGIGVDERRAAQVRERSKPHTFTAIDDEGRIVFESTFSWDELRQLKFVIEIWK